MSTIVSTSQDEGDNKLAFEPLRSAGVCELERLASDQWTDFNSHDPGITILEQVCWALTDLGYRLDYPIPDLLAEGGGRGNTGFVPPADALGSKPVTMADLRRLILDIEGISNVWIEPDETPEPRLHYHPERRTLVIQELTAETEPLRLQGLWRVLISCDNCDDRSDGAIIGEVAKRLYAHRPLAQDFTAIEVLGPQDIVVQADIEVGPVADTESLLIELLHSLSTYISPRMSFRTLQQRQADGQELEELFDGPTLNCGFIDHADMPDAQRRTSLRTSDLIRVIMDVPGIRAVRHIRLAKAGASITGAQWQDWVLELDQDKTPRLQLLPELIRLHRHQVPVRIDTERVKQRFHRRSLLSERRFPEPSELAPPLPLGSDRQIGRYHSILHQFPEVYGVGPAGLPPRSSPLRRAQMKQLKAYLQLFDQMLAHSFAQAANAARLLSSEGPATPVYTTGVIEADGLALDTVHVDPEGYQDALAEHARLASESPEGIALRRRQLDHLLARVGETFVDPVTPATDSDLGDASSNIIPWDGLSERRALLADIAEVTATRGSAADSLRPFGNTNRGGLERRITLKLGLRADLGEKFYLIEHILLRALQGDDDQTEPLLRDVASADPYSLQLSYVFPADAGRFAESTTEDDSDADTHRRRQNFRRSVEHLIREETPAHLSLYVHWLSKDDFEIFEQSYGRWHEQRRISLRRRFNLPDTGH